MGKLVQAIYGVVCFSIASFSERAEAQVIYGDVDGNKSVSSNDAALIKRHILGQAKLSGDRFKAADVNVDGKVDDVDF